MLRKLTTTLLLVAALAFFLGCSNIGDPVTLDEEGSREFRSDTRNANTQLWGMWTIVLDPADPRVIPLRSAEFNLNVLCFLEPPALVNLTLEGMGFSGSDIDWVDIGLRHPFPTLTEFTGFDVKGIVIADGDNGYSGFIETTNLDGKIVVPNSNASIRLTNPDGFTDLFNPVEYPFNNSWLCYKDGILGAPDDWAHYVYTVNPYKYFSDDLELLDEFATLQLSERGMFSAGQKNVRRYDLLGEGVPAFNYAVAASWEFPLLGSYPWEAPGDFQFGANQEAPIFLSAGTSDPGLKTNGTGSLTINCNVHDWQDNTTVEVRADSPLLFGVKTLNDNGNGNFSIIVSNETGAPEGTQPILLVAESAGDADKKSYQVIFVDIKAEGNADWSIPVKVNDIENISAFKVFPFGIVVNGTYWLFWMGDNGVNNRDLFCRRYDYVADSWDPVLGSLADEVVNLPGSGNGGPMFVRENSNLHGTFPDEYAGEEHVYYVLIDTTLSDPFPLPSTNYEVISSDDVPPSFIETISGDLVVNSSGTLSIVWVYGMSPDGYEILMREGTLSSWSLADRLTDNDELSFMNPRIQLDPLTDNRHIIYDGAGQDGTYYWDYDKDPPLDPPDSELPFTGSWFNNSSFLINGSTIYIALDSLTLSSSQVYFSSFSVGQEPSQPEQVTGFEECYYSSSGNLVICDTAVVLFYSVWQQNHDEYANINGVVLDGAIGVSLLNILLPEDFDEISSMHAACDEVNDRIYVVFVADDGSGYDLWFTETSY